MNIEEMLGEARSIIEGAIAELAKGRDLSSQRDRLIEAYTKIELAILLIKLEHSIESLEGARVRRDSRPEELLVGALDLLDSAIDGTIDPSERIIRLRGSRERLKRLLVGMRGSSRSANM